MLFFNNFFHSREVPVCQFFNIFQNIDTIDSKTLLIDADRNELHSLLQRYHDWIQSKSSDVKEKVKAIRRNHYAMLYHSNAIEGISFSYSETKKWLKYGELIPGKTLKEHYEVLGLKSAFGYLNRTLRNGQPLTIDVVQGIHKRVLYLVNSIEAGSIRNCPVSVGEYGKDGVMKKLFYIAPAEDEVPALMQEFVEGMESLACNWANHPVIHAAIAHLVLVNIHPWVDGNGRSARLVMNFYMMQAGFPPVIIPVGSRRKYFEVLRTASRGDLVPFVRFIAERTVGTLRSILGFAHRMGCFRLVLANHIPYHFSCCAFCPSTHHGHVAGLPFEGVQPELASEIDALASFVKENVRPSFGPNRTKAHPNYAQMEKANGNLLQNIILHFVHLQQNQFHGSDNSTSTMLILASALLEQIQILLDMGFKPNQLGPAFTKAFKRLDEELLAKLRLSLSPVEVNNDQQLPGAGCIEIMMSFQLKALSENGELLRAQLDVGEEKHTYERMLEQLALVFLANALQTFPALLAENTNAKKNANCDLGFAGKYVLLQLHDIGSEQGPFNKGVDVNKVGKLVPVHFFDLLEPKRKAWELTGQAVAEYLSQVGNMKRN